MANDTTKVVMIVDTVSPTPFALLRRAKQFEYRDDDIALQHFAEFEDPVDALTEECRRVLRAISLTNQSHVSDAATSTSLKDPSWSRFEDIGFGSTFEDTGDDTFLGKSRSSTAQGLNSSSKTPLTDLNRPTTPSWADFLSSGFADENGKAQAPILLHPEKSLPPISTLPRGQSSQSHRRDLNTTHLEPGELASIVKVELDDAFWWVWITSLAGEEPVARKAAFGRCALIETTLLGGQWLVMEEQVKGAAPDIIPGAYVAERKSFFSFTKKGRLTRRRSNVKKSSVTEEPKVFDPADRMTLDQERHAKIQKAAAELAMQKKLEEQRSNAQKRGRNDENAAVKTSSVFTLGPMIKDEASPALQWAKQYDKKAIREQYLGDNFSGKGSSDYLLVPSGSGLSIKRSTSTLSVSKDLPPTPNSMRAAPMDNQLSLRKESIPDISKLVQKPNLDPEKSSPRPVTTVQPVQAPSPPATLNERTPSVTELSKAPSVTELSKTQSRTSTESRTSNRPEKEKHVTEKSRLKKLGFNAPPPVAANKNGGMKKIFGTLRRKHETNNELPAPDSPTNEDPAVAAARRALEGKPARPEDGSGSPPLSPNHFAKFQNAAKKPSEIAKPIHEEPKASSMDPPASHDAIIPERAIEDRTHQNGVEHMADSNAKVVSTGNQMPSDAVPQESSEIDGLSQVDGEVKASAAREFSRFDQGPLVEQPAFAPAVTPPGEDDEQEKVPAFEPPHRPQHQSVYSTVTAQTDGTDDESPPEYTTQLTAHDRWAQIRRNAAERAAMALDDHGRNRTETRTTDDGETSGEESKCL